MRFVPPRCPNTDCPRHSEPRPGFCVARGWYRAKCRLERIPRFRCRTCRRSFSRQTFRHDCRDKRPETNAPLFTLLTSGVGLRQAARALRLDIRAVQQKLVKFAATCAGLLDNVAIRLAGPLSLAAGVERARGASATQGMLVPLIVERSAGFLLGYDAVELRLAKHGSRARRTRKDAAATTPPRRRAGIAGVVGQVARKVAAATFVQAHTDGDPRTAAVFRRHFGAGLEIRPATRKRPPGDPNPLAPVHRIIAMGRDNCGRLRPRSWLATRKRERLVAQLHLFAAYLNLGRRRFNRDPADCTPAHVLGLLPRRLRPEEILGWRQDWRERSCHPLDASGRRSFTECVAA